MRLNIFLLPIGKLFMKTRFRYSLALLCLYALAFVGLSGCGGGDSPVATAPTTASTDSDQGDDPDGHDDDGHDHDEHGDHDGHDHPAHGPNGGHIAELSGGAHAEWMMETESGLFTVIPENPETVSGVLFQTKIGDIETPYELSKGEDGNWTLTSPELATAVLMGDAVDVQLQVTTDDGQATGRVEHHAH